MVSCFSKAALEPGRGCAQMALGSYRLRVMPCLVLSQSPCEKRMFPNQLCRYGYVTNSKVKFVMVVDSSNTALRDNEIRSMFRKLHSSYTDVMCNPFYNPGDRIQSRAFDSMVTSMMVQVC